MAAWLKKLYNGGEEVPPPPEPTEAEKAAARELALKNRKFGELVVRFHPDVKECDKAGVHFIVNEDTKPIPFETSFFIGRLVVRIKDAVNAPETTYWNGKARKFSFQVQGRFKKRVCSDNVRMGCLFQKPLIAPWGSSVALKIMCTIDPSLRHDIFNETKPWEQLSAVKPTADKSNRGLGPWPFGGEKRVEEDAQLFLPETVRNTTKKMDFKERCNYYADEKIRKTTFWEPDLIYNLDFFSSRVDFNTFDVVVGPFRKNMGPYMNQQPFDFRAMVYDEETNTKIIGHVFAIQVVLDRVHDGEVAKAEHSPSEAAALDAVDIEKAASESLNAHFGLTPTKKSAPATDAAAAAPAASNSAAAAPSE